MSDRGRGFAWIVDLMILTGILATSWPVLKATTAKAGLEGEIRIVSKEARELYEAFERFYGFYRAYPNAYSEAAFAEDSLDPLSSRGYYRGSLPAQLRGQRIDAYDSPDDRGLNQEFWVEMTLERDPSVRFLVARSDDAPLASGEWVEGAFVFRDGELEPLE